MDGNEASLYKAGTYTATIDGIGNVSFGASKTKEIIIGKDAAGIAQSDLANAKDSLGNSLWKAYYGNGNPKYVTNDTENALDLVDDAYTRHTGEQVKLLLNGSYLIGE